MENSIKKFRNTVGAWDVFNINVYDRKLQLVFSGQFREGQEPQAQKLLQDCSLLFDVRNTSYYLRNY